MSDRDDDLVVAVSELRDSLVAIWEKDWPHDLRFGLGDIELTLQLVRTRSAGGKVGWSLLGAEGSYESARTHTVKLTLQPLYRTPDGKLTRDFTVAAQQTERPKIGVVPPTTTAH